MAHGGRRRFFRPGAARTWPLAVFFFVRLNLDRPDRARSDGPDPDPVANPPESVSSNQDTPSGEPLFNHFRFSFKLSDLIQIFGNLFPEDPHVQIQ